MCFSDVASFTSSAVIFLIGSITLLINYKHSLIFDRYDSTTSIVFTPHQKELFMKDSMYWLPSLFVPILFALQQFIEGIVWVLLNNNHESSAQNFGKAYFFFVSIVWPILIPIASLCLQLRPYRNQLGKQTEERHKWYTQLILGCIFIGASFAIYSLTLLFRSDFHVEVKGLHIFYHANNTVGKEGLYVLLLFYTISVALPQCLVTTVKGFWIGGLSGILSLLIIVAIDSSFIFVSIWCFFAAWISTVLLAVRGYDLRDMYLHTREGESQFHANGEGGEEQRLLHSRI